jgi:membrane fusion protein (multidrug efflux system)
MERAVFLTLALVGPAFLVGCERASGLIQADGSAKPGASGSAAAPPPLVVDAVRLAPRPLSLTVPANGTLLANESVDVTPELSRRVVKVAAEDGATVKKGDLLFKLDDADLLAELRALEVRKKLLVDQLGRQSKLHDGGLASEQDLVRARAELELVDAQRAQVGVTLARTSVRAPFDGRLGLRNVSVGAMVGPQTSLVSLEDTSRLKLDLTLPERHAPYVNVGGTLEFRLAQGGAARKATVLAVEPRIDATSRSLRVRAVVDNADATLRPGAFVTVDFPIASREGAMLVPSIAVVPSVGGHQVWIEREGKAVAVDVELGLRTDTEVELIRGVAPGALVLTTNLLRLRPGAPVKLGRVDEATGDAPVAAPAVSAAPAVPGGEGAPRGDGARK